MKKLVIILVLAIIAAGGIFAQEEFVQEETEENSEEAVHGVRRDSITLDIITLVKGFIASDNDTDTSFFCISASYERLVAPHFSFGAEADVYFGKLYDVSYMYFGVAAAGRFYTMSEHMEKFFIGASLGFNSQSVDGKTDAENGGFSGLTVGLRAGYKLLFAETFFVEPSMSYTYSKGGEFFGATPVNIGWQGGLRIGFSF